MSSAARGWRELLERHNALVRRELLGFRGREVDTTGDGFLATFDGARAQGRSVSGLERAMIAAIRSRLDRAVAAGRITSSQEQQLLSTLSSRLRGLIERTPPLVGRWGEGPRVPGAHPSPLPPF